MSEVLPFERADAHPDAFEEFWRQYPRKVGKPLAKAKFEAIVNGGLDTRTLDKDSGQYVDIELTATPQELIEGAKRYRADQTDKNTYKIKDGGRYTLYPATFLNQGRWLDE